MAKLRRLEISEIEKLSNRKGVKKIAVENFLMTVTTNKTSFNAYENLYLDSRMYKWNSATIKAISRGIELASSPRKSTILESRGKTISSSKKRYYCNSCRKHHNINSNIGRLHEKHKIKIKS